MLGSVLMEWKHIYRLSRDSAKLFKDVWRTPPTFAINWIEIRLSVPGPSTSSTRLYVAATKSHFSDTQIYVIFALIFLVADSSELRKFKAALLQRTGNRNEQYSQQQQYQTNQPLYFVHTRSHYSDLIFYFWLILFPQCSIIITVTKQTSHSSHNQSSSISCEVVFKKCTFSVHINQQSMYSTTYNLPE